MGRLHVMEGARQGAWGVKALFTVKENWISINARLLKEVRKESMLREQGSPSRPRGHRNVRGGNTGVGQVRFRKPSGRGGGVVRSRINGCILIIRCNWVDTSWAT